MDQAIYNFAHTFYNWHGLVHVHAPDKTSVDGQGNDKVPRSSSIARIINIVTIG